MAEHLDREAGRVPDLAAAGAAAAPAAAPAAPAAAPARTPQQLVEALLPRERAGVAPDVADELRGLRGLGAPQSRASLLAGVDWCRELRRLRLHTAAGPDGLRPEHLLCAITAGPGAARRLGAAVGAYARALSSDTLCPAALAIALAARVAFIPKRDGGERPLGVVGVLRRIVARAAAARVLRGHKGTPGVLPYLVSRGQFGAGAPAGVEGLAAFAQAALDGGGAVSLVDRETAYSRMEPDAILAATEGLAPALLPLARVLLSPALVVGPGVDTFCYAGLFMGCSLSPALFAITEEALLEPVRPRLRDLGVRSGGFLDDGALAGAPDALREAFELVEQASARGGQRTNVRKSLVLARPEHAAALAAGWPGMRVETNGALVVGVPVGDDDYVRREARGIIERAARARQTLLNVLPAQQAFYLLRAADGWPRVQHVLRGTPVRLSAAAAAEYDRGVLQDFARLVGEPSRGALMRLPLARAVCLPMRLGGCQLTNAGVLRGVAAASATVQAQRLLTSAFPPVPRPPNVCPPIFLPRLAGRPARVQRWEVDAVGECRGAGRCHMPEEHECARHMCAVCCALAGDGDGGCAHCAGLAAAALRALDAELPGLAGGLLDMVALSARAAGAPDDATWAAFVLATRYAQPQRAVSCALHGFMRARLDEVLSPKLRRTLEAAAEFPSYAWLLAAPVADFAVPDAVFACAMRMRLSAPILLPKSVRCQTAAGGKPRSCTINGCANGEADAHALSCKCGGHSISSHNYVRVCLAALLRTWGLTVAEESHDYLPRTRALKMDLLVTGAGLGQGLLAIDLTRRFAADAAALLGAECAKVAKYAARYMVPVTLAGFAFSELGACGRQARAVGALLVNAAARLTAGDPADLSLEFWATFGVALWRATTARFAHFARLNGDRSAHAPQEAALVPGSFRRVTGATFMCPPRRFGGVKRTPRPVAAAVWRPPRPNQAGGGPGVADKRPGRPPRRGAASAAHARCVSAPSGARVRAAPSSPGFVSLVPCGAGVSAEGGVSFMPPRDVVIRGSARKFVDDDVPSIAVQCDT